MNNYYVKGILLYTKNIDNEKKLINILNENSQIESFFIQNKFFDSTNSISLINYVFKQGKKHKNIIYIEKVKEFININRDIKKVSLIHLVFELFKEHFSINDKNSFDLYYFLYFFLDKLDKIDLSENNLFLRNLIFLITLYLTCENYLNINLRCNICNKDYRDGLYYDIKNFLVRCKEHKTSYSYYLSKVFFEYIYKVYSFYFMNEINRQNLNDIIMDSLPSFGLNYLKKILMFYEKLIYNIREGKKLKTFKFINYLIRNDFI